MKRKFFLTSLVFTSMMASAQMDTTELLPVEVRAVRAAEGAPLARTNLGPTEISKQNTGQDLPFVLNRTPSVVVNSDAGNGVGYTGIRIRGTDASRINVTLNGIPFNDAESQGTFFVNLPDFISSVSSIQVQRGVGTSSNGPGAFGASIAMSTNEVNRQAYAELNNSVGSFQTLKHTIKVGSGLLNDHFTVDARLSRITSDGYMDRAESDLKSFYLSTAYLASKGSIRLNMFSGKERTYQAWYGVSEQDLATNRTINYAGMERPGEPYDNETDNYSQDHYQLFFDRKLSDHLSFNTAFFLVEGAGYYEQYKAGESYADYGLPNRDYNGQVVTETDLIRQLWLDNSYYGNIFSFQHRTSSHEIMLGGTLSKYKGDHFGEVIWAENGMPVNAARWYDNPAEKNDVSFYAKGLFQAAKALKLFGDIQWRGVNYHINGFRDNPSLSMKNEYSFWNPKLGATLAGRKLKGYLSYSIGHKEPNRDDFEAGMNEMPRHETLHDWEAGLENRNEQRHWSAGIYYMKYKDQLVLTGKVNDVGAYTRTNIANSYRLGLELEGGYRLSDVLHLAGNLTLSRNRIEDFKEYIDDYDNGGQKINSYAEAPISFSPSVIGAASLSIFPVKQVELELLGKYVSKQYLDNTGNESRILKAHYVQDFRAAWTIEKWVKKAQLFLNVNNLLDKKYEPNGYTFSYIYLNEQVTENYYYPMAGRNWMVGLNINF